MADDDINWQEAVARLARERALVETWLDLLRLHRAAIDPAVLASLALSYGEARAEYDAVIAGLTVALARRDQPSSLPDLLAGLERGFRKREAFRKAARALVPLRSGERSVVGEILASGAVALLIKAVQALYFRRLDDDALTRRTIQAQLEAARWPDFDLGPPPP